MFAGQVYYNTTEFVKSRPMTLYDHFKVDRMSDFQGLKKAKDFYMQALKDKADEEFEGDPRDLLHYNMTKEEVSDAFNVLTNAILREAYDKHNIYYNENDFVKKMGKNIPNINKYTNAVKGVGPFGPFILIIFMSLGAHATVGRKMAISGLLFFAWISFEMKRPATYTEENWVVLLINKYYDHEYVVMVFGT